MSFTHSPFSEPFRTWQEWVRGVVFTSALAIGVAFVLAAAMICTFSVLNATNPVYPFPRGTKITAHWADPDRPTRQCYRVLPTLGSKNDLYREGTRWLDRDRPEGSWKSTRGHIDETLARSGPAVAPFAHCGDLQPALAKGVAWSGELENFDMVIAEDVDGTVVYAETGLE